MHCQQRLGAGGTRQALLLVGTECLSGVWGRDTSAGCMLLVRQPRKAFEQSPRIAIYGNPRALQAECCGMGWCFPGALMWCCHPGDVGERCVGLRSG